MLWRIFDWARTGREHDIPWCCGLRFGWDQERPNLIRAIAPRFGLRLGLITSPRGAFASWDGQGYVPCELHLFWWLLTGWWPTIKQDGCEEPPTTS